LEGDAGAVQACRGPRDGEPCTELLGLDLRPTCKRLARNARWEAQIVLDARSAASLSTRTCRLDDNRVESLRSSVHRRSKARRSRADDRDIVHVARVDLLGYTKRISQLAVLGILQDGPAVDDDDRQCEHAQVEWLKRGRGVGILLGIQKSMWVAIACEKGLNTKGIAGMCAAHQDDPALRMLNQSDPAKNERPKDNLADVRLSADHPPKRRSRNANNLCRLRGACAN